MTSALFTLARCVAAVGGGGEGALTLTLTLTRWSRGDWGLFQELLRTLRAVADKVRVRVS